MRIHILADTITLIPSVIVVTAIKATYPSAAYQTANAAWVRTCQSSEVFLWDDSTFFALHAR
jgi:hypothetical protein